MELGHLNLHHVLVLRARSALLRSGRCVRVRVVRASVLSRVGIAVVAHSRWRVVRVVLVAGLRVAVVVIGLWLVVHDTKSGSKVRVLVAARVVVGHERDLRCLDVLLLCLIGRSLRLHVRGLVIELEGVVRALSVLNLTVRLTAFDFHFSTRRCHDC